MIITRVGRAVAMCMLGAVAVLVSACNAELDSRVAELEEKSEAIFDALDEIRADVREIQVQRTFERLFRERYRQATFDPAGDEGFQRIDTSVGSLAVSIAEVRPVADGSTVVFNVGNLTAANIAGAELQILYGARPPSREDPEYLERYEEWQASLRERTASVPRHLRSGAWNRVSANLPAVPPAQLGYLEVSVTADQIMLTRAQ